MKTYAVLRGHTARLDLSHDYLCRQLDPPVSPCTFSRFLNNKTSLGLEHLYQIMDIIGEPYDRLPDVFPRNGGIPIPPSKARRRSKAL